MGEQVATEQREASMFILISWELTALKAQMSHIIPAVKMNSPFNCNLNHRTGSYPKAKMTQHLHSKRISFKVGSHGEAPRKGPVYLWKENHKEATMLHC